MSNILTVLCSLFYGFFSYLSVPKHQYIKARNYVLHSSCSYKFLKVNFTLSPMELFFSIVEG